MTTKKSSDRFKTTSLTSLFANMRDAREVANLIDGIALSLSKMANIEDSKTVKASVLNRLGKTYEAAKLLNLDDKSIKVATDNLRKVFSVYLYECLIDKQLDMPFLTLAYRDKDSISIYIPSDRMKATIYLDEKIVINGLNPFLGKRNRQKYNLILLPLPDFYKGADLYKRAIKLTSLYKSRKPMPLTIEDIVYIHNSIEDNFCRKEFLRELAHSIEN